MGQVTVQSPAQYMTSIHTKKINVLKQLRDYFELLSFRSFLRLKSPKASYKKGDMRNNF